MMAKDSVKRRIEGEVGLSYTEFAYQLMQGYDFYWLYKNKNCKLQMGGSDQCGEHHNRYRIGAKKSRR
jgi:tyrosyl-tRNA synthetase